MVKIIRFFLRGKWGGVIGYLGNLGVTAFQREGAAESGGARMMCRFQ